MNATLASKDQVTERQLKFVHSLIDERDTGGQPKDELKEQARTLTRRKASAWIERLLELPRLNGNGHKAPWPDVEEGHYALRNDDDVVKFYQVDRPEEGKWAGFTFLSAQASDERWPIKNKDTKRDVLTRIADDPQAAMRLYGQELGECGKCGRTLTDEESRRIGIGPVCRKRLGL